MLAFVVTVPANEAELASDALWALGVAAIEERTADDTAGTEDRFVELWTSLGTDVAAITRAADAFPSRWRWRTVEIDPRSPTGGARTPCRRGSIASSSSSRRGSTSTSARVYCASTSNPVRHSASATIRRTVLSMRLMQASVVAGRDGARRRLRQRSAVDRRGPPRRPVRRGHRHLHRCGRGDDGNAERNGVAGVVTASTRALASIDEPFDVVVANLLAPVVVDLANDLRRVVAPSARSS